MIQNKHLTMHYMLIFFQVQSLQNKNLLLSLYLGLNLTVFIAYCSIYSKITNDRIGYIKCFNTNIVLSYFHQQDKPDAHTPSEPVLNYIHAYVACLTSSRYQR